MNIERKALYDIGTRNRKIVIFYIREANNSLEFDSLKSCIQYLRGTPRFGL